MAPESFTQNQLVSPSKRWWDLPAALLLLVMLSTAFLRLVATQWTSNLNLTRTIAYLGLIAGLALGFSRFKPRTVGLFGLVYGIFIVIWQLGMTMDAGIPWLERLRSLVGRLTTILNQLVRRQPVFDSLLFLVLMGLLFWFLSAHAGYTLVRFASPWRIILPTGLALVVIQSYDPLLTSRLWYLVVYLFFALVLVARLVFLQHHFRWEQTHTYTPPNLGIDIIRFTLIATVSLMLVAWTAPRLDSSLPAAQEIWARARRPLQGARDLFDKAFASLRSTVGVVSDSYGTSMSLGRGSQLSDEIVFRVQGPELRPVGVRYYWRARVYDTYVDGQWRASYEDVSPVSPDEFNITLPIDPERSPGFTTFEFTLNIPLSTIFTAPQPLWISRPAHVENQINPDGSVDISAFRANPILRAGETYTTRASLSMVTVAELRDAGTEYPDWVRERYLQVPTTLTPRTLQLARDLTAELATPYDKVSAITNWLRANIEYTESVPQLPGEQEPLDWFLFTLKQGFCNYYATAEIMLLRSIGIPARVAVGYAQGETEELSQLYTVRQRDSHAWPEVYFPGLGWVEFEPTAAQGELLRPLGSDSPDENDLLPNPAPTQQASTLTPPGANDSANDETAANRRAAATRNLIFVTSILAALALLLVPLVLKNRLYQRLPSFPIFLESTFRRIGIRPPKGLKRWFQQASLSPLNKAYMEINRALTRLGERPAVHQTPAERVDTLVTLLPEAQEPAERLLVEYEAGTYGQQSANIAAARQSGDLIRSLSFRAAFQRLLSGRKEEDKEKEDLYHSLRW